MATRKEDKLRPYRVDYFDISEMKENDLALVRSVIVRAVTAAEAIYHDDVAQEGRIIIRCYRYYKTLGAHKKDVFKPVEDLFTANKAIKIMDAVEAFRAKPAPVAAPVPPPPSPTPVSDAHVTRFSDSSLYDEVCVNCGATDAQGKLDQPCPTPSAVPLSGADSPATVAVVADLNGMLAHDTHEQTMDTFVPTSIPDGKRFPDPTNTLPVTDQDVANGDAMAAGWAANKAKAAAMRTPHWTGCACDVCDTKPADTADTEKSLWVKIAIYSGALAAALGIIYLLLHSAH